VAYAVSNLAISDDLDFLAIFTVIYVSLSQLLKLDFKLLDTACIVFVLLSYIAKI